MDICLFWRVIILGKENFDRKISWFLGLEVRLRVSNLFLYSKNLLKRNWNILNGNLNNDGIEVKMD